MVLQRRGAARSADSKAALRDGRQEGRSVSDTEWQSESQAPVVPEKATQGAETQRREWSWVEATVWNERMLAALGNGVRGGKCLDDHLRWSNAFFATQGLFTMITARELASQSR